MWVEKFGGCRLEVFCKRGVLKNFTGTLHKTGIEKSWNVCHNIITNCYWTVFEHWDNEVLLLWIAILRETFDIEYN